MYLCANEQKFLNEKLEQVCFEKKYSGRCKKA